MDPELPQMASKSPQHFMKYLLCPQIQRDEFAAKISDGNGSFTEKLELSQAANIQAPTASKLQDDANYWASGARKGDLMSIDIIDYEALIDLVHFLQ